MATTLIVEDGSIITNANSYNDIAAIKAYAALRGFALNDDDAITENQAILAMDYIESFRQNFKGIPTVGLLQSLSWPRTYVIVGEDEYLTDYIPPMLKSAQCRLVVDINKGIDLLPSFATLDRLKKNKTGPLEKEWFESPSIAPVLTAADALLAPLLEQSSFGLRTVRV